MLKVAKQFAEYHPKGWEPLYELIRKRASRHSWAVPSTIIANAQAKIAAKGKTVPMQSQRPSGTLRDPEKTGTLVTKSLSEMGEEGSIIAGKLSLSLLRNAENNPERIAPIVDTKDIAQTVKTLRLVAGMDKQGPVVSLNLWQGQGQPARDIGTSSGTALEVETLDDGE
jgi:hypothetical protein